MDVARAAPVSGWRYAAGAACGLAAVALALHFSDPARAAGVANFGVVFSSLLIEAVPFIALGAVVSALIEVFVPARLITRLAALPASLQVPASGLAGLCFPVCECGSVPVARRLVAKGLTPAAAITFMLAAPVLNPVVIASTAIAYRGRDSVWAMVLGRVGLGLVVAMAAGWVMARAKPGELVRAEAPARAHEGRAAGFFGHLAGDFVFMGRYLVLGAAIAAALQTFVPQDVVASVADLPVIDLAAMMGLAFVLSLCSESDAFVAASFVQFGVGAQLAFLVFGPMVDTKLAVLYTGTFSRAFARTVVVVVFAVTLAGTLWIEVLLG
ncbi:MAG TPA: permease [Actinomycetota bacterium]|nr:permease [Actinomycetota bacterium]